jgi:hypothetical protein
MKRQLEILLGQHPGHLYIKIFNVQRVELFAVYLFEVGYSLVEVSKSPKLFKVKCTLYYTTCHLNLTFTKMVSIVIPHDSL